MESSREILARPARFPRRAELANVPWWVIILVFAAIVLTFFIFNSPNYHDTFFFIAAGVTVTLRITLFSFPISMIIGLMVGLGRLSKNPVVFTLSTLYVELIRGIPLVVFILMLAFGLVPVVVELMNRFGAWGLAQVSSGALTGLFNWFNSFSIRSIPMELRAIIALGLAYGAFEAEVFRGGIQSIGKGQMEASRSLGMNYIQSMRFVILPQAVRRILPPLGNDFIALLKDSSLATVLALNEITQLMRLRRSSTFRFMEAFYVGTFLYLSMTLLLSGAVRVIEKRMRFEE